MTMDLSAEGAAEATCGWLKGCGFFTASKGINGG
jgi:hypothetical protein